MNEAEVGSLMAMLIGAFPNNKVTAGTIDVYKEALADLDYQQAHKAVMLCIQSCTKFPTVAEIRKAALAETKEPGAELPDAYSKAAERESIWQWSLQFPEDYEHTYDLRTAFLELYRRGKSIPPEGWEWAKKRGLINDEPRRVSRAVGE